MTSSDQKEPDQIEKNNLRSKRVSSDQKEQARTNSDHTEPSQIQKNQFRSIRASSD